MIRATLILVAAVFCASCSATYRTTRDDTIAAVPRLDAQGRVYVSVPEDGAYETTPYVGSGLMVTQAVVAAFAEHVAQVVGGTELESEEEARSSARASGFMYLIIPSILHWEERATEWSGRSDVIKVGLRVFEVSNGNMLDSLTIDGKSRWFTFGGDHPQDLLPDPLADYAESVYE